MFGLMIFGDVFFCKTFCSQVVELVLFVECIVILLGKNCLFTIGWAEDHT